MSEDREKLRSTIDELHTELSSMEHVDEDMRELLAGAVRDIHGVLNEDDDQGTGLQADDTQEPGSVVHRLAEAAKDYEESHPTLSGILGSIVDTLSRMGI